MHVDTRIAALAIVALALTACGGTAATTTTSVSATTAAATPAPSVSPLDAGAERAICADLDATAIADGTPDVQGAAAANGATIAQVVKAVADQCPDMTKYMPPSGG
jgi:hypothetical protein